MDLEKIVFKIRSSQLDESDILKYGKILITEYAKYYHTEQLRLGVVSQQREMFYNFITWYNAKPKVDKPENGLITTNIIDEYLKL